MTKESFCEEKYNESKVFCVWVKIEQDNNMCTGRDKMQIYAVSDGHILKACDTTSYFTGKVFHCALTDKVTQKDNYGGKKGNQRN